MKKSAIIAVSIIGGIVLIVLVPLSTRLFFLHLNYNFNENDVGTMEVHGAIDLHGSTPDVTDKQAIKKVLDYLNGIPLIPVPKPDLNGDISINISGWLVFKDNNGNELATVSFFDGGYVILDVNRANGGFDEMVYDDLSNSWWGLYNLKLD